MAFVGSGLVARRDCQRVGKKRDEGWCSRRERVRAAMIGDDVKDDQVVKFKTTEDKKSLNLLGAQVGFHSCNPPRGERGYENEGERRRLRNDYLVMWSLSVSPFFL